MVNSSAPFIEDIVGLTYDRADIGKTDDALVTYRFGNVS